MDLAKASKFLAAGLLLFTLLGDNSEACKCGTKHPHAAFCSYDVVLRVKYVESGRVYNDFKIIKVYKGPEEAQDVRYVGTRTIPGRCEYHYEVDHIDEYIIAGKLDGDTVWFSGCGFIKRWSWLTPEQKRGFTSEYSKGCSCSIVRCSSGCSITSNQCAWSGERMPATLGDLQYKHMACLPQVEKSGMCTWKSLVSQESGSFRKRQLTQ